jgi:4,5-dihydroxyphthalate decarboxylase
VVKDTLLHSDPSSCLFAGFEAAKVQFLKALSEASEPPPDASVLAKRRSIVSDDPLPNGLERNRKALEAIIRLAHEQKILPRLIKPEEMFAANTLNLK